MMTDEGEEEDQAYGDKQQGKKIAFKLLSRDNKGRLEARQLLVPETNTMAVKLMKAEVEQRIAKERLKQRVLEINSMNADNEVRYSISIRMQLLFVHGLLN